MHEQVQEGPSWNQGTHLKNIAAAKTLAGTPLVPSQSFYTAVDGSLGSLQIFCLRCVKNERPLFAFSLAQFQERCLACQITAKKCCSLSKISQEVAKRMMMRNTFGTAHSLIVSELGKILQGTWQDLAVC